MAKPAQRDAVLAMTRDRLVGILALVASCVVWGLSPLYYALLAHVPPLEVLCYRTLWSLAFFAFVLMLQGRLGVLRRAVTDWRVSRIVVIAAVMISINWFVFIYSVQVGHVLEASIGYYIFPLVAVVLGWLVFGERLTHLQIAAVCLAGFAVVTLTLGLGVAPWVALILAGSFGTYGVLKKGLDLGPVVSVTAEVLVLAPLAIFWLVKAGEQHVVIDWPTQGLLAASGLLTGLPLILFSFAARRVTLSTVGVVQYVNPTLQFGCAVLFFGNVITPWHAVAFPMIWTALAIYSWSAWQREKMLRRARVAGF